MTWNLNLIVAVLGCGAMAGLGLYHTVQGRRLYLWWFVLTGIAAIIAAYFSDRRVATLLGIFIGAVLVCAVLTMVHMLVLVRKRRVPRYVPIERRSPRSSRPRRLAELAEHDMWEAGE